MASYGLCGGETVGRQFHHKRSVFALDEVFAEQLAHHYGHQDADGIEQHHDGRLILGGEEGSHDSDIDGQPGRAAHQR